MNPCAGIGGATLSLLAKTAALSGLNDAMLERLCSHFEWLTIDPGQAIIKEGDPSDFLLLVVDGNIEITRSGKVTQQLLGFARPGSIIGEMGIFTREPRYATCRATQPSRVGLMTRARFQQLQTQDIELYLGLIAFLGAQIARRLAKVSNMVVALKQQNEIAKLAATRILDTAMAA